MSSEIKKPWSDFLMKRILVVIVLSLTMFFTTGAFAQTEQTAFTFTGSNGNGPYTGLIQDSKGNFYGATVNGGAYGGGGVYKLTRNAKGKWKQTVLYSFSGGTGDGAYPQMPWLAIDKNGHLYGTTSNGGAYGDGIVFELESAKPEWKETILHTFTGGSDGSVPYGSVTLDSDGNVYGTTTTGGDTSLCLTGCGVVFELSPGKKHTWTFNILHTFEQQNVGCGVITDGADPNRTTLAFDSAGDIFGTTSQGGYGCGSWGTVWELSPSGKSWNYSQVYVMGTSGIAGDAYPDAGGVFDKDDNFYFAEGTGNIGELVKANGYTQTLLYQAVSGQDGNSVYDTVSFDSVGNLYWTSQSGFESQGDKGGVYKLSPNGEGSWNYTVLNAFSPDEGTQPFAGVMIDASGNVYGTCSTGGGSGDNGQGTVFEITP
jgi:uncharacterized repeat protein (TIGR03803 family)